MQLIIREIDKQNDEELRIVTERCMSAVLETIPEFEGSEDLAKNTLSNFSYSQMQDMIRGDFTDATKRIIVAESDGKIVGQALYSIKKDAQGTLFGFCFSRYVDPAYRRSGIATALLNDAMEWFKINKANYISAHTHISNVGLQELFKKFGFKAEGPFIDKWEYFILTKVL
jgi:ribosomal protein S18 acetylase RimI-like enzyme